MNRADHRCDKTTPAQLMAAASVNIPANVRWGVGRETPDREVICRFSLPLKLDAGFRRPQGQQLRAA